MDRENLLTIGELAASTGIPIRTIRYYASQGLLPPPRLLGRTGLYDERHQARVEAVRAMQHNGLSLHVIRNVLDRLPQDASADEVRSFTQLATPAGIEDLEVITNDQLDMVLGFAVTAAERQVMARSGIIQIIDGTHVGIGARTTTLLRSAGRLGLDRAAVFGILESLSTSLTEFLAHSLTLVEQASVAGASELAEDERRALLESLTAQFVSLCSTRIVHRLLHENPAD